MILLLESAARALALGAIAAVGVRLFRIRTPQVRHIVWTVVLATSLAMPLLVESLRTVAPVIATPVIVATRVSRAAATIAAAPVPKTYWFEAYVAVAVLLSLRLGIGLLLTYRIQRRARVLDGRVRVSAEVRGPVTFGRTILLPSAYPEWTVKEREAVLRHELAHCERGDFYTQLLSKVHRAVFWFNPMAWWLERHLADLAEQACDDAAVESCEQCPAYAELLLRFAVGRHFHTETGVAMARISSVGKRVERLLDAGFEPGHKLTRARKWQILACLAPLAIAPALLRPGLNAQVFTKEKPKLEFVIQGPNGKTWMSGDSRDLARAGFTNDIIWFRRADGVEFVVDDPAAVAQARGLLRMDEKVEKEMETLAAEQQTLGAQQETLGEHQTEVKVENPNVEAQMKRLSEKMAILKDKKQVSQEELAELQAHLGELQAKLGEAQATAGEQQAKLGEKQATLGEKQAYLGKRQAELGEQLARHAEKATAELDLLLQKLQQEGKARPMPR